MIRNALLAITFMLSATPSIARTIEGTPVVVEAHAGKIEGRAKDGVAAFVGIPYVKPPVGDLRWRPPQPMPRWDGVREAVEFGHDCPQVRFPNDFTPSDQPMSEDCLVLNIWRPEDANYLPVMVWIHGGAFFAGSSNSPVTDGDNLALRGVVLVSFNYRLGRFGFFAHPALSEEVGGDPHASFAVLDMIAALTWVRDNIAAFGGDPDNVTIFGESAGGAAVALVAASPMAEGLFDKAIIQSGAPRDRYALVDVDRPGRKSARFAGVGFAAGAGLRQPDAAALRALPAETVQGGLGFADPQPQTFTGPIIDGHSVVGDPDERLAAGEFPVTPFIVGSTSAELSEEVYAPVMMDLIRAMTSIESMAMLERAYGDPPNFALIDDWMFTEGARLYARKMSARGAPSWRYIFDHVAEAERATREGAKHASEIAYLFGNLPPAAGPSDRKIARLMGDYWTNFARDGNPNGEGLPYWPPYDDSEPVLVFADEGAEVVDAPDSARLDAVERARAMRRSGS